MRSEKLSLGKFPEAEGGSADASVYRGAIRDEAATHNAKWRYALRDYVGTSLRDVGGARQPADYEAVPEKRAKGTSVHGGRADMAIIAFSFLIYQEMPYE